MNGRRTGERNCIAYCSRGLGVVAWGVTDTREVEMIATPPSLGWPTAQQVRLVGHDTPARKLMPLGRVSDFQMVPPPVVASTTPTLDEFLPLSSNGCWSGTTRLCTEVGPFSQIVDRGQRQGQRKSAKFQAKQTGRGCGYSDVNSE